MSAAEFARPHPKQPRYSNGGGGGGGAIGVCVGGVVNSVIPMHQRSPTGGGSITAKTPPKGGCHNNNDKHLNLSQTMNGNDNGNAPANVKNGYACHASSVVRSTKCSGGDQSVPVNLVTNHNHHTQHQAHAHPNHHHHHHNSNSNSIHHNSSNNNVTTSLSAVHSRLSGTPPGSRSSSSSSVDVENDGSMSPIVLSAQTRKPSDPPAAALAFSDSGGGGGGGSIVDHEAQSNVAAAAAVAAAYQFNFPHLYVNRALYGAPGLFSGHHTALPTPPAALRPHPTYLGGLQPIGGEPVTLPVASNAPHETSAFSAAYMHAVQNAAAAGIYNSAGVPPSQPSPPSGQNLPHSKAMLRTPTGSMIALSGPTATPPPGSTSSLSNGHSTLTMAATPSDLRQKGGGVNGVATATNGGGTYLNGKVNNVTADTGVGNYFKVPSGKEGSLKHRILTRPSHAGVAAAEKSADTRTVSMTAAVVKTNGSTTNFTKGAYIELSSGVLRRVEDMRTEDFIQSADRSPHHQLTESTVVKIKTTTNNNVVITFSYDKNRCKVDVEVSSEHPFFVYGQGWASFNPDLSNKAFGLKCQRLQVGDICISLTSRDPPLAPAIKSHMNQMSPPSSVLRDVNVTDKGHSQLPALPQNLSRKQHASTLPETTVANVAPTLSTNRLSSAMAAPVVPAATGYPLHNMPLHLLPSHLTAAHHHTTTPHHHHHHQHQHQHHHPYADIADMAAAYVAESVHISRCGPHPVTAATTLHHHPLTPSSIGTFYPHAHHHQAPSPVPSHNYHLSSSGATLGGGVNTLAGQTLPVAPVALKLSRSPSSHHLPPYYESPPSSIESEPRRNHSGSSSSTGGSAGGGICDDDQDQPVDASVSRKRRWSAPESICDEETTNGHDLHAANAKPTLQGYKAYVTATAPSSTPPGPDCTASTIMAANPLS